MDGNKLPISPLDLYALLGSDAAPIVVDVRRDSDFTNSDRLLSPAFHRSPDHVEQWQGELSDGRPVVTYCFHGDQVSQGAAIALRAMGVNANFLAGGIAGAVKSLATGLLGLLMGFLVAGQIWGRSEQRHVRPRGTIVAIIGGPGATTADYFFAALTRISHSGLANSSVTSIFQSWPGGDGSPNGKTDKYR